MKYQFLNRFLLLTALFLFMVFFASCGSTIKKPYVQIYDEMMEQEPDQPPIMNTAKSDTIPEPWPPKRRMTIVESDTIPEPWPPQPRITNIEWSKLPGPIPSPGFFNVTTFVPEKPSYKIGPNQIEIMKLQNKNANIPMVFIKELAPGEMYFIMRIKPKKASRQTTRKRD